MKDCKGANMTESKRKKKKKCWERYNHHVMKGNSPGREIAIKVTNGEMLDQKNQNGEYKM